MSILSILFTWIWLSCGSKDAAPPYDPPYVDTTMVQYGTPFNSVTDRRDAVIYQVNTRIFSSQGNFAGVTTRLDSIKALGVNVIYLMPVYPVGIVNAINSPYCIRDYMSVNSEFGTLADLRALVEAAHSKGMSVILDWVANHTAWDHTWISGHRDWYMQNSSGNIISPPGTGWNDVAQLNFNSSDMRLAMIKAMKYWVYKANVDGFRCDYADGPPLDFWKQAIDSLRGITTHTLLLLAEGSRSTNYSAGFDYNFGFSFFDKLKTVYGNNQPAISLDNLNSSEYAGSTNGQQVVRYTSNHDVNGAEGTPLELFGGRNGSIAAFIIASCMKSVPMIYGGQEVGTPVRQTFPFTSTKIDWTINPDITAEYKKIIAFRNNNEAVRRGILTSYSSQDVCAFVKEANTQKVLVLANVRNSVINYTIPAGISGSSWTDVVNGGTVSLSSGITLQPNTYFLLKN